MTVDDFKTLQGALEKQYPHVIFRVELFDCNTRLAVTFELANGERGAIATPESMDWRALSMQEWLHRVTQTLAPRLS